MDTKEKERYRFSTRTGVLADTGTGQPAGRVLRTGTPTGHRPRWAVRCNCHPATVASIGRIVHYPTRTAAVAGLVAHLDGER